MDKSILFAPNDFLADEDTGTDAAGKFKFAPGELLLPKCTLAAAFFAPFSPKLLFPAFSPRLARPVVAAFVKLALLLKFST